jgi:outer membrane protein TolC
LTVSQLVKAAFETNPRVRAARARWSSATHNISQNYVPADPMVSFFNLDSPSNGINKASSHSIQISQALQFPGKGYLQGQNASRMADIARLTYEAALRDVSAEVQTAYYQILLDISLEEVGRENVDNLQHVLRATQVEYSANRVTQADFISSEFDLAAAQEQLRQFAVAQANDRSNLNRLLGRSPDEPLPLESHLEIVALQNPVDAIVARAAAYRQEILEAALSERNSDTAVTLAELEYAPDFSVGYIFDHFLLASAAPSPTRTQTHGFSVALNMPLFFWFHQSEDVKRASFDLRAAREDLQSVRNDTATQVVSLYRQVQLAYHTAVLYRDSLIPLARQNLEVALIAYQGGRLDFTALSAAVRRQNDARVSYLQAANQFLAAKISLEQWAGGHLLQ